MRFAIAATFLSLLAIIGRTKPTDLPRHLQANTAEVLTCGEYAIAADYNGNPIAVRYQPANDVGWWTDTVDYVIAPGLTIGDRPQWGAK